MADLPHTWPGYIQTEEQQFTAAVSEYTGQRLGQAMNYLKDASDTNASDIASLNLNAAKTILTSPLNFAPVAVGVSLHTIVSFVSKGTPIALYWLSGKVDSGTDGSIGFARNGSTIYVNDPAGSTSVEVRRYDNAVPPTGTGSFPGTEIPSITTVLSDNDVVQVAPLLMYYEQPASGVSITYQFRAQNFIGSSVTMTNGVFLLIY